MSDLVPIEHYQKYNNLLRRASRVFVTLITLLLLLLVIALSGVLLLMLTSPSNEAHIRSKIQHTMQQVGGWLSTNNAPQADTVYVTDVVEVIVDEKLVVPNRTFNVEGVDVMYAGLVITAAYESFRPKAYKDGKYPSVGFGFNLHPDHQVLFKKLLGRSACPGGNCMKTTVTKDEAVKLLKFLFAKYYQHYLHKYKNDERSALAAALRAYNRGMGAHDRHYAGSCCGAKVGCGSKDYRIRTSHMSRRLVEFSVLTSTSSHIKDIVVGAENKLVNKLGFNLEVFK